MAKTQIEKFKATVMESISFSGSASFDADSEAAPQYHEASRRRHHTGGSLHHSISATDIAHQYESSHSSFDTLSNSESAWW